jgi:hypothetical protein
MLKICYLLNAPNTDAISTVTNLTVAGAHLETGVADRSFWLLNMAGCWMFKSLMPITLLLFDCCRCLSGSWRARLTAMRSKNLLVAHTCWMLMKLMHQHLALFTTPAGSHLAAGRPLLQLHLPRAAQAAPHCPGSPAASAARQAVRRCHRRHCDCCCGLCSGGSCCCGCCDDQAQEQHKQWQGMGKILRLCSVTCSLHVYFLPC